MPKKAVKQDRSSSKKVLSKTKKSVYMPSKKTRSIVALFSIALAVFILFHEYSSSSQGLLGVIIEKFSLTVIGTLGFVLLPFFLFIYAGSLLYTVSRWSRYFFMTMMSLLSCSQLIFYSNSVYPKNTLKSLGYLGVPIHNYSLLFFGDLGALLFFLTVAIVSLSLLFDFPAMALLAPLQFIYRLPVLFVKVMYSELKKTGAIKRLFVQITHALFFNKIKEQDYELRDFDEEVTADTSDRSSVGPVVDVHPEFVSFQDSNPSTQIKTDESQSFTVDMTDLAVSDANNMDNSSKEKEAHKRYEELELKAQHSDVPLFSVADNSNYSKDYQLPPLDLLKASPKKTQVSSALIKQRVEKAAILEETLASFNVIAKVVNISAGPSVTRFELQPGDGVKISKITSLHKDIALKLAAPDVRIEAPIPGKSLVGIEVPNTDVEMITLRSILEDIPTNQHSKLEAVLGKTISGESIVTDIGKMPHLLIAGATGSGKSVCINAIILSILMKARPDEVKLLMIDPKKVELSLYEGIPHLLAPVVTDPHKAAATLKKWALVEMEKRYELFSAVGVKDLKGYNNFVEKELLKTPDETNSNSEVSVKPMPYIVVIIDELADLMMVAAQDVESTICRLAQMARATGIHLVIATQRPSVNVITGLIKANVPSRISFYLQSQIDSRTILDMPGAERLLGKGDMLYSPVGSFNPMRVQGVFVSETEVHAVVSWLKKQAMPDYVDEILAVEPIHADSDNKNKTSDQDELFEEAKQLIMTTKYASTSYLQRKLRIGYNRAARIMDELEESGVIAEYIGDKKARQVS